MSGYVGWQAEQTGRNANNGGVFEHTFFDVPTADDDYFLNDEVAPVGTTTYAVADFLANGPLWPGRNVDLDVTVFPGTLSSATFIVVGRDVHDQVRREVLTADAVESVIGAIAFSRLSTVTVITRGTAGTMTFSLGFGLVFSIGSTIGNSGDVKYGTVDGVREASPVINVPNSTWTPATVPNAARDYHIAGQSTLGIAALNGAVRPKPGFLAG